MSHAMIRMSRERLDDHNPLTQQESTNTVPDEAPPSPPDSTETTIHHFTFDDEPEPWFALQCRRHYKVMFCALLLLTAVLVSIVITVYYNVHAPPTVTLRPKISTRPPTTTVAAITWDAAIGITFPTVVHMDHGRAEHPMPSHSNDSSTTTAPTNGTPPFHAAPATTSPFESGHVANSSHSDTAETIATTTVDDAGNMTICENVSGSVPTLRTTEWNTVVSESTATSKWTRKANDGLNKTVTFKIRVPDLNLTDRASIAGRYLDQKIASLGLSSNSAAVATPTVMPITKTTLTFKKHRMQLAEIPNYDVSGIIFDVNTTVKVTVPVDSKVNFTTSERPANVTSIDIGDMMSASNVTAAGRSVEAQESRTVGVTTDQDWLLTSESVNVSGVEREGNSGGAELMFWKGFSDGNLKILHAFQDITANGSGNVEVESSRNVTVAVGA